MSFSYLKQASTISAEKHTIQLLLSRVNTFELRRGRFLQVNSLISNCISLHTMYFLRWFSSQFEQSCDSFTYTSRKMVTLIQFFLFWVAWLLPAVNKQSADKTRGRLLQQKQLMTSCQYTLLLFGTIQLRKWKHKTIFVRKFVAINVLAIK